MAINLTDTGADLGALQRQLNEHPIDGLKEVLRFGTAGVQPHGGGGREADWGLCS